jgi:hypothetical protein
MTKSPSQRAGTSVYIKSYVVLSSTFSFQGDEPVFVRCQLFVERGDIPDDQVPILPKGTQIGL